MDAKEKEEIIAEVLRRIWSQIIWAIVLIPVAYVIGDYMLRGIHYFLR